MSLAHTARSSGSCGAAIGAVPTPVASPQRMLAETEPQHKFCHSTQEGIVQGDNSNCVHRRPFVLEGPVTSFLVETTLFDRLLVGAVHPTSLLWAGGGPMFDNSQTHTNTLRQRNRLLPKKNNTYHTFERHMHASRFFTKAWCRHLFNCYMLYFTSQSAGWEYYAALR